MPVWVILVLRRNFTQHLSSLLGMLQVANQFPVSLHMSYIAEWGFSHSLFGLLVNVTL